MHKAYLVRSSYSDKNCFDSDIRAIKDIVKQYKNHKLKEADTWKCELVESVFKIYKKEEKIEPKDIFVKSSSSVHTLDEVNGVISACSDIKDRRAYVMVHPDLKANEFKALKNCLKHEPFSPYVDFPPEAS